MMLLLLKEEDIFLPILHLLIDQVEWSDYQWLYPYQPVNAKHVFK